MKFHENRSNGTDTKFKGKSFDRRYGADTKFKGKSFDLTCDIELESR